jgi:hypothetical protein
MSQGPKRKLTRRAVSVAAADRKVMYRKRLKAMWYLASGTRRRNITPPPETSCQVQKQRRKTP